MGFDYLGLGFCVILNYFYWEVKVVEMGCNFATLWILIYEFDVPRKGNSVGCVEFPPEQRRMLVFHMGDTSSLSRYCAASMTLCWFR